MSKTNPFERRGDQMPTLADMTNAMMKKGEVTSPQALVQVDNNTLQYKRISLTATGLSIPDDVSVDEWQEIGSFLFRTDASLKWWLGDWINFGENRKWGETYARIASQFEMGIKALYNISLVCRKVEFSRRRENLSFTHHQAVASLAPDEQSYFLDMAIEHQWTMRDLRNAIKGDKPPTLSLSVRRFRRNMAKNREMLVKILEMPEVGQGDILGIADAIDEEIEALLAIKRQIER